MAWVSDTVFSLLVVTSGVLAVSTVGFAVAWLRARERAIRAEPHVGQPRDGDARMERLEHAMESMAVEVERMAEGQQFVSRLLARRADREPDASVRSPYVATPH
jgi:hypothetical protein